MLQRRAAEPNLSQSWAALAVWMTFPTRVHCFPSKQHAAIRCNYVLHTYTTRHSGRYLVVLQWCPVAVWLAPGSSKVSGTSNFQLPVCLLEFPWSQRLVSQSVLGSQRKTPAQELEKGWNQRDTWQLFWNRQNAYFHLLVAWSVLKKDGSLSWGLRSIWEKRSRNRRKWKVETRAIMLAALSTGQQVFSVSTAHNLTMLLCQRCTNCTTNSSFLPPG